MKTKKAVKKVTTGKRGRPFKNAKVEVNPFEILNDVSSTRGSAMDDPNVDRFISQLFALQAGNRTQSVNIPTTLYPTKKDAYNLVRVARYKIKNELQKEIVVSVKTIVSSDSKKVYLGTRIFRIK